MAGTKAGSGTGTQAAGARELVAIAELADMLWQLGAESTEVPIDVAPYLDGLKTIARRIQRMTPLDAGGRELAARHYYAGVIAGACGDDSAIARGVSDSLVKLSGGISGRRRVALPCSRERAGGMAVCSPRRAAIGCWSSACSRRSRAPARRDARGPRRSHLFV
ncbi:hypothetical protein CSX04_05637 [Burkholderia cepacia]|nr:hypothetical protein CSX04_05637 [Burkholderia cepacia]